MKVKKIVNNVYRIKLSILHKDVILTTFFQFAAIFFGLILLPKSLELVKPEEYGLWLAIGSIFVWISYFDFGLSAGLKNKLIIALANNDHGLCREYVSTAFFLNFIIAVILGIIFFFFNRGDILVNFMLGRQNYDHIRFMNVKKTLNIVYIVFLIRFFFQTVNPVFEAKQKLYLVKFVLFISQMMIYIVLLTLANKVDFDLFRLALVFSIIPVLILVATAIFFFISNPLLRPSLFLIRIKLLPELYSLSIRFFLIQLNMLVLFQSTNFLILRNLGSSEVVKYNIVINLFSMMNIAFSSISAPYWAAYTSAWTIGDTKWIKKTQLKLLKIWLLIVLISSIVLLNSSRIYILWVGNSISIPFELSVAVFVYMCFFTFGMIFNIFLNSTGKIYLQTLSLTILTLCYIPLVVLLIKVFKLGLISIPISLCIVSLYTVLVAPFQSNRLLNGVAKGLFNK